MFYACNKRREEQCGFFQWCDEAPTDLPPQRRFESNAFSSGGGGGGGAGVGGGATSRGSCFKCNQTGHFARDCTADAASGGGRPGATYPRSAAPGYNVSRGPSGGTGPGDVPQCGCGIPATSRTVSKEGVNQGRAFFVCINREPAKCAFFQWADSATAPDSRPAQSGAAGAGMAGGGVRGGGKNCFKCNQPGHFARDCENQVAAGGSGGRPSNFR
jgi:hypothetical protein